MFNDRSKTLATWLAAVLGPLGVHRWYLHGWRDPWGWLHLPPTLVGLVGLLRFRELGQDDRLAWLLLPVLGVMIAVAALSAIVLGLTPDERWAERYNPGHPAHATGWGPVLGVIFALLIGATALMSTVAFGGQHLFEWLEARSALR